MKMLDSFLVCGLGSLGQDCIIALKKFGVKVIAIEQNQPIRWERKNLPSLIDNLIIGDCSEKTTLIQAQIQQCRAALIVTTSEKVNTETAIAIRQLNAQTRLVVRSGKENLSDLLSKQLGNFIAYEPTHLPANAYAISALGTETLGILTLDHQQIRISQIQLTDSSSSYYSQTLAELQTLTRRIINHCRSNQPLPSNFYQWNPQTKVLPQDTIIYLETENNFRLNYSQGKKRKKHQIKIVDLFLAFKNLKPNLIKYIAQFWQLSTQQQIRRVAFFSGLMIVFLSIMGTFLFKYYYPNTTFLSSFYVTAILLLGGYGDLFGRFESIDEIPEWLQLFSLGLTLIGTAFVGVLYALLTEALLSSKFQLPSKRPPIPQEDHIVIIGFGRIGQKIASLLREFKQSVLAITLNSQINPADWLELPLIVGSLQESLKLAHLDKAKSVVIVTDDDIFNVEVALMVQTINPQTNLVIRTNGDSLTENLTQLFPQASVIGAYQVAAEAFAGAAFGENILHLYRFGQQTILVTEYQVESDDTLNGLLLSEVAYGYEVIPVFYEANKSFSPSLIPSDDVRLGVGDRLVILATIEGLKRIENDNREEQTWELTIKSVNSSSAAFEGANAIARISGCSLPIAREAVKNLPQTLPIKLYQHQGIRLVNVLRKNQVYADLQNTECKA